MYMARDKAGHIRQALGKGDLTLDAYGTQRFSHDFSIFHGMFTFDVPKEMWVVRENDVEIYGVSTKATSVNGKLNIKSGAILGNKTNVCSRRHPRYQPNRGLLYSSSVFLPEPDALGIRDFGSCSTESGIFFRLKDGVLYGVVRNTVDSVTTDTEHKINLCFDVDLSKGNIYDIQAQWRGVGNIKFFIGNPETGVSEEVLHIDNLGKDTELSAFNPAMPLSFSAKNTSGVEVTIEAGCVDLTSEGGLKDIRQYSSVTSAEVALSTAETPVVAFRIPLEVDGTTNTRDCALRRISGYANDDALLRVYYFRDPSLMTATWSPVFGRTFQEVSIDGAITVFNKASMLFLHEKRIPANGNIEITNPDEQVGDLYITAGDYIFVTIEAKNNTLGGVTLEYGQEI